MCSRSKDANWVSFSEREICGEKKVTEEDSNLRALEIDQKNVSFVLECKPLSKPKLKPFLFTNSDNIESEYIQY